MSSNLVKNIFTTLSRDEEKRIIDSNAVVRRRLEMLEAELGAPQEEGFVSGIPAAEIVDVPEDTQSNIIKAQDEAREILENARAEADAVIARAQEEAEHILEQARVQAEAEKSQVLGDARQQGYNEGLVKAQAHEGAMEQEYLEKTRSLEEAYEKQLDTLEPRFVDTITGIYEHIFQIELSSYREILTFLISSVLHKLDGSRSFIIHVSREDYAYVSMQKKQMLAGVVSGNCEVDVVEDLTLGKNDCMIETEGGIFDCGLGTQLSELRRRLHLLAWSQDGDIS
ncbi:MAG: hypothetical protein HFH91_12110 [Lachnospiraceae bacterium]|nr:hypothetical protein [Lachnospiraceae bacterium]